MAIVVRIPTPLRAMTKGAAEVHAEASTIGDVITDLERQFPGLRDRIVEESGEIRLQPLIIFGRGKLLACRQREAQNLQGLVARVLGVIDARQVQVCVGPRAVKRNGLPAEIFRRCEPLFLDIQ